MPDKQVQSDAASPTLTAAPAPTTATAAGANPDTEFFFPPAGYSSHSLPESKPQPSDETPTQKDSHPDTEKTPVN